MKVLKRSKPDNDLKIKELIKLDKNWSNEDFRVAADILDYEFTIAEVTPYESAVVLSDPFVPNRYLRPIARELQMRAIKELARVSGWNKN